MEQIRRINLISTPLASLLAAFSVASIAPIAAQPIAAGGRVRITAIDNSVQPYEGTFLRSSRDSIWFTEKKSDSTFAFPLQNAFSIEQSTQYKPRFRRAAVGGGIGFAVGLGAGNAYWQSTGKNCHCEGDVGAGMVIVVGAHLLGAIGAALGSSLGGEQWKMVTLPLQVSALPMNRRQVQLPAIKF